MNFNKTPLNKTQITAEVVELKLLKRPKKLWLWSCVPTLFLVVLIVGHFQGLHNEDLYMLPIIAVASFYIGQFLENWGLDVLGIGLMLCIVSIGLFGKVIFDIAIRFGIEDSFSIAISISIVCAINIWAHFFQNSVNEIDFRIDEFSGARKEMEDFILTKKSKMPENVKTYMENVKDRSLTQYEVQEIYKVVKTL